MQEKQKGKGTQNNHFSGGSWRNLEHLKVCSGVILDELTIARMHPVVTFLAIATAKLGEHLCNLATSRVAASGFRI